MTVFPLQGMMLKGEQGQSGFILASTLWILAFITIAAGFFALWASETLEKVSEQQASVQGEIDLQGTRAVILYLLSTQYLNEGGLSLDPEEEASKPFFDHPTGTDKLISKYRITLDDQVYRGMGDNLFSIQDESGLVSLNMRNPSHLLNLLGVLGVPGTEVGPLIAKLQDYTDEDDLFRLNGAEAGQYKKLGRLPPANRRLQTSWETAQILDWDKYKGLWQDNHLPRLSNSFWDATPNFNTAPERVLQSWNGITREDSLRLMEARRQQPFQSPDDVYRILGKQLGFDSLGMSFFPSRYLRLSIWRQGARRMKEVHVQLTPQADQLSPWLIEYEIDIPVSAKQQDTSPSQLRVPYSTPPDAANE